MNEKLKSKGWSIGSAWDFLFGKSRKDKVLEACGCVCYCPNCGDILNDQAECQDWDLVRYKCGCGHVSEWLFDAPCPILVRGKKK